MISLLLLAIFAGVLASMSQAGVWSNLIMLIHVILGSLVALNYFEPVAVWAGGMLGNEYAYLLDLLSLWGLFGLSVGVGRALTDVLSQVKVKFLQPVDQWLGLFVAACVGWVIVCFASVTLHVAPLSEHFLGFEPKSSIFLGFLAPDRQMLGFAHLESVGAMSRSVVHLEGGQMSAPEPKEFDPKGDFVARYSTRRAAYEKVASTLGPGGG
jgi:hypothetical protein